jgi:hypothetical protein
MNILESLKKYIQGESRIYNDLIRKEAKIGGQLFGNIPRNTERSFFCLDQYTWVWHENIVDNRGRLIKANVIRYDILPDRIIKIINDIKYPVEGRELTNFYKATKTYQDRVFNELNYN